MRSWRWGGALFTAVVVLSSCRFDGALAADASIECGDDLVCPMGMHCQPEVHLCLADDAADRDAPQVLDKQIERTLLTRADAIVVRLTVSEPLTRDPVVTAVENGVRIVALQRVSVVEGEQPQYVYRAALGPDDLEGTATLSAELIDRAGNSTRNAVLGTVTMDFTAPRVESMSWVAPRSSMTSVPLRANESAQVRISLSEPVQRDGLQLIATPVSDANCTSTSAISFLLGSNAAGLLDFSAPAPVGSVGCEYTLQASGLVDLAGNVGVPAALTPGFHRDDVAPTLSGLEIRALATDGGVRPGSRFSHQPQFNAARIAFVVSDSAVQLGVSIDAAPLASCGLPQCSPAGAATLSCGCDFTVPADASEGPHVVLVNAGDAVGNTATASTSMTFDFTAPGLIAGATRVVTSGPPGARLPSLGDWGVGGALQVSFTLDEPPGRTPEVQLTAPELAPLALVSSASTTFAFQSTLDAGVHTRGPIALQATVVDDVGNGATLTLPTGSPVPVLDAELPTAVDTLSDGGVVFHRVPWGAQASSGQPDFRVTAAAGAAEPGARVLAFDGPTANAIELGRSVVAGDGSFVVELPHGDRTAVWLQVFDSAGNASTVTDVKDVEWVATLNGKVPGSVIENPHDVSIAPWSPLSLDVLSGAPPRSYQGFALADDAGVDARGGGDWVLKPLTGALSATPYAVGAAYDPIRGQTVVFGGNRSGSTVSADTLIRTGLAWQRVTPTDPENDGNPVARYGPAFAWDSARGVAVMFGGTAAVGFSTADVWEWNGRSWRQVLPTDPEGDGNPTAGAYRPFVFDSARSRLLLTDNAAAVWAWQGESWLKIVPTDPENDGDPTGGRSGAVGAFDPVRGAFVFAFGGGPSTASQTWEFNGTSWALMTPTDPEGDGNPTGQSFGAMAWWPGKNVVAYFANDGALWEWNGVSWKKDVPTDPECDANPVASVGGSLVFDVELNGLIKFGGNSSDSNEVWFFNGTSWAKRSNPDPENDGNPGLLFGHASVYEAFRKVTLVIGGQGVTYPTSNPFRYPWRWNGFSWAYDTTASAPLQQLVYTSAFVRVPQSPVDVISVGGLVPNVSVPTSTYRFTVFQWQLLSLVDPENDGNPAAWGMAATNTDTGAGLLFGGTLSDNSQSNALWSFNQTFAFSWAKVTPTDPEGDGNPPAMTHAGFAYDANRHRAVLFGSSGDTWEWNGTSWLKVVPTDPEGDGNPTGQTYARMTFDSDRSRIELLNNDGQLWEWDGRSWALWAIADARNDGRPGTRGATTYVYDPNRKRCVSYGGTGADGPLDTVWEFDPGANARPAQTFRFDLGSAGLSSADTMRSVTARAVAGGTGRSGISVVNGASLAFWQYPRFSTPATNANAPANPSLLEVSASAPDALAHIAPGPRPQVYVMATPVGVNGPGTAVVSVDYAELSVRYRRP